jgi:probable HAF family extracellular repeat protein
MNAGLGLIARRALLFACAITLLAGLAQAQQYTITDLGLMSGNAVNDLGEVVGGGYPPNPNHAFLWIKGKAPQDLGTLPGTPPGGQYSSAVGINHNGEITGVSGLPTNGYPQPYFKPSPSQPMENIGLVPNYGNSHAIYGNAYAINNLGDIVGSNIWNYGDEVAFFWSKATGVKQLYHPRGGRNARATSINDVGQIAGYCQVPDSASPGTLVWRACLWAFHTSIPHSIGTLPHETTASMANAINHGGEIVGWSSNPNTSHAFLWSAQTGMTDLGVLDTNGFSNALAINSSGEVVGVVGVVGNNPNYRPFVWTKTAGMKDLNHLIPSGTGWALQFADSINTSGQIVGFGLLHGQYHGYLLTPR